MVAAQKTESEMGVLDRIGNVLFGVACLTLTVVAVRREFPSKPPLPPASHVVTKTRVSAAQLPDADKAALTVIVAIRSSCPYCTASMPFYKDLIALAGQGHGGKIRVVFVSTEALAVTENYLTQNGIRASEVRELAPDMPVRATPTLFVVGRDGAVVDGWQGQLNSEQQGELLARLKRIG